MRGLKQMHGKNAGCPAACCRAPALTDPPREAVIRLLPVIRTEVVLLQRDRLARTLGERVPAGAVLERGRRVHGGPGVLGRLDSQAPVALHPGACRD